MPNIKSAKKRVLVSEARNERNRSYRSALRTSIKRADAAIASGADDMDVAVKAATRKIDMAVSKGLLHKKHRCQQEVGFGSSYEQSKQEVIFF